MTTEELITALFYEVDEQLHAIPTHPEAHLWPSEVVTVGLVELSRRVTPSRLVSKTVLASFLAHGSSVISLLARVHASVDRFLCT